MELVYRSTRNAQETATASMAILKGLANEGGLFVPDTIPAFDKSLEELSKMDYREVAYQVMKLMLTDFTEEELRHCINSAYDSKFDTKEIAPLVHKAGAYYLELFHGATIAFKDMALSILPYLLTTSAKKNDVKNEIVILTATSGDTGKAALEGFKDVAGTRIIVFYPDNGVSEIQKLQMVTQEGNNVSVAAVKGNFDDAQSGVKKIFTDTDYKNLLDRNQFKLSSANSINWGRLLPQIVYYISAYCDLVNDGKIELGDKINVVVPTGNFGNILASYYASLMGLPINKFICASNSNNVLTDFIKTGVYDKNRNFYTTISPSMDILVSSNLERFLYDLTGCDDKLVSEWMKELNTNGSYEVSADVKAKMQEMFTAGCCDDAETMATIKKCASEYDYVIDTHTAVAKSVYDKYVAQTGDTTKTIIASTASPFKFTRSVMEAIDEGKYAAMGDFELIDQLSEISGVAVPNAIEEIRNAEVRHNTVADVAEMPVVVKKILGIQ